MGLADTVISLPFIIINVVTLLAPAIALGIAALVIADQNQDITCDGTMMPLPMWLNVFGGTGLGLCGFLILALLLLTCGTPVGMYAYVGIAVLYQLFMIAWNVVGAVALFRDSSDCQEAVHPIWAMTLSVLIIQWIGFCFSCCCTSRVTNDDE